MVVVLALLIWIVLAVTGGDDPDTENTASEDTISETTPEKDGAADAAAGEPSGSAEASGSGGSAGGGSGSSGSGDGASGDGAEPDDSSTRAAAPVAPGQCSDQSLAVRVTSAEPNYQVGAEPEFTIVITNIGTESCDRDLGAGLQQVLVYTLDGNTRLWSNTDCFSESTVDVRSLSPGDQAAFSVKWSGTTSEPGCEAPRDPVGPGAYTVVGQLGGLRSTPEPFNIAP